MLSTYNTQACVEGTSKTRSSQVRSNQVINITADPVPSESEKALKSHSDSLEIQELHHFQTEVCLKFGKCNHLRISFLSPPPHFMTEKFKKLVQKRILRVPRRFVTWMLQQEEIRSRRNPPCQLQPTAHQTNWLIVWANSWCSCGETLTGICTKTYRI